MTKINMTYHVLEERMERITKIATTVGFGEPLFEVENCKNNTVIALTDTGVVIVKSPDRSKLITMYMATYVQADAFFHLANQSFPSWMKNVIKKNVKKYAFLY